MTIQASIMGIAGIQTPAFVINFNAAGYSVFDFGIPPGDARSTIELRANGDVWRTRLNSSNGVIGTWATGSGFDANDYDFRWVGGVQDPNWGPSDPIDTWINGGATITWGIEETGIGTSQCDGTLQIRPAGGGSTIDTATVNLEAESTP